MSTGTMPASEFERLIRLETRLPYEIAALRAELMRELSPLQSAIQAMQSREHHEAASASPIDIAGYIKLAMSAVFILAALQLVLSGKSDVALSAAGKMMGAH